MTKVYSLFILFALIISNPSFCAAENEHLSGPIGPKIVGLSIGMHLATAYKILQERFPDKKVYYNPKEKLEANAQKIEVGHPYSGEIHVYSNNSKKLITEISVKNPDYVIPGAKDMQPEKFALEVFKSFNISNFRSNPIYWSYKSDEGWDITIFAEKIVSLHALEPNSD